MRRRITVNKEEAIGKILDGEAIIINLVTGAYYSTAGVGAVIWNAIEEGRTTDEIVAAMIAQYDVEPAAAANDLDRMIDTMRAENLVHVEEAMGDLQLPATSTAGSRAPYEPPEFHVYRDMRDLLALDPPMPVVADKRGGGPGTDSAH